ncbi:MAG: hypothetical protein ACJ76X_18235 [Solirubrobacteraceae bacterium]
MAESSAAVARREWRVPRIEAVRAVPASLGGAMAVSLIVQLGFIRASWFYLDDIRNLAEARQRGLTWGFLTTPIGEHLAPGHRLLDWLVAVPFGRHWAFAVLVLIVFSAVFLSYLAGTLTVLFGSHKSHAIPVLLAGTAWPLLGTGQWFAGAGHAIPVAASISGALYHYLRARSTGERHHYVATGVWTLVGLLFSLQAVLIAPILFVCALVARGERPNLRIVMREGMLVVPLLLPAIALDLYERAHPWATHVSLPSLGNAVDLVRVVIVRALLPALAGIGMDGAPPDPSPEKVMRLLALIVLAGAFAAAIWLRRRWLAAAVLAACAAVLTSIPIALARLGVGIALSGSEPRYLLPGVLLGALAIGALLAAQPGRAPRTLPSFAIAAAGLFAIAWVALYCVNLSYTYRTRRVALDFGQASERLAHRLERGLRQTVALRQQNLLVDGPLPFPLFYLGPGTNLRSAYGRFFIGTGLAAPGVPTAGELLTIGSNGAIETVRFRPTAPAAQCRLGQTCRISAGPMNPQAGEPALLLRLSRPAAPGSSLRYQQKGPPDAAADRRLPLPAGAKSVVVPAVLADQSSVVARFNADLTGLDAVQIGQLVPVG